MNPLRLMARSGIRGGIAGLGLFTEGVNFCAMEKWIVESDMPIKDKIAFTILNLSGAIVVGRGIKALVYDDMVKDALGE